MNRHREGYLVVVAISFLLGAALASSPTPPAAGEKPRPHAPPTSAGMHGDHRTPDGWEFTWPQGDPVKGREVFVKLECYSCHEVAGEKFSAPTGDIGPELSVMGPLHHVAYFAETIINPNAAIEPGKGYEAADGSSKMPSYNELVTVQEVIDLVAYLKGLKPTAAAPVAGGSGSAANPSHGEHSGH